MEATDPITAFLTRDWAALGGWSLFIGLVMFIVLGSFKEWWVPGPRYRRTEDLLDKSVELNKELSGQNTNLIQSNEIVSYFFEETAPRRRTPPIHGSATDNGQSEGGDPA